MKVRQIIRSGGFEPEDVKLLDAVFDACWHQMECHYLGEDMQRTAARERLATSSGTLATIAATVGFGTESTRRAR